ncbi:MAG: DUF1549 domain-containing protein [Planctomycetaceae bacterium]|nr:DUF1549 domain-containing protein [Planctomycetaceae bacterium]
MPTCSVQAEQAEIEFFEKKIRPVLVKHCYKCHSSDSASVKGKLLLDSRQGLLTGGESGPAIAPGKPGESLLIESLKFDSYEMPPSGKLPDHIIQDFEQWIQRGAIDPRKSVAPVAQSNGIDWEAARQFWAFQPLPKNQLHAAGDSRQASTVKQLATYIDQQLNLPLSKSGITANPPAIASQRIRRLYYDLTGLPPSPADVLEFTNNPSDEHWAKIVEKLLASPRFGQQWGRHWLDVVRYADSNGGDFNATYHNAWRYRDYVIDSFNNDKPIDEFFREQIAGDLLPARDDADRTENLVATGFLMIGPKMLSERDKLKLRYDVVDEQIDTLGKVFLGISLGCARCHDHKFDPVPTEDYYALAGIFHGTQVLDGEMQQYVSDWKRRELPTTQAHRDSIKKYKEQVAKLDAGIKKSQADVKQEQKNLDLIAENLPSITIDNKQAELIGKWTSSTYSPGFVGTDYIHDAKLNKGKNKAIFKAVLPEAGRYQVLFAYMGSAGRDTKVPVSVIHGESVTKLTIDQTKKPNIRGNYILLGEFDFPKKAEVQVVVSNEGTTDYVIADAVQFVRLDASVDMKAMMKQLAEVKQKKTGHETNVQKLIKQIAELKKNAPAPLPQAIGVQDFEECVDCEIHIRGEYTNLGKVVPRGVLKIISGEKSALKNPQGSGRLELANWLTGQAYPIVSRVFVNRIWMHLFGEGIVRSVDNFGTLGIAPSHPQLLNQLSVQFIENGWSQKQIVHAIVLTQAYQRSSIHQPAAFKKDPTNSLLWAANRQPLTAEQLRDTFLVYQQSIDETPGGSTVTHLGKLAVDNNKQSNAARSTDHVFRRSVYQPVLRNQLEEIPSLFDFANPEMVVGKRPTTNVPAQSLYLLNNKEIRKTAEAIVDQMFAEHGAGSYSGLNNLYLTLFARESNQADLHIIQAFIDQRLNDRVEPQIVRAVWADAVQALMMSTEFRYID